MDHLRRFVQALRLGSERARREARLSSAQLFVLTRLHEQGGATINELALRTMTHQSSVSAVVSKLERARLVRRRRSSSDGRAVIVSITPLGARKVAAAPALVQNDLARALTLLEPAELTTLAALMQKWTTLAGLSDAAPAMFFESETPRRTNRATTP